jgi:hypothetical protein
MNVTIADVINGLNFDEKGNRKMLIAWGFPSERNYDLIGYEYNFSLVNNVIRVIDNLKGKLGKYSGEYLPYPVDSIEEGLELYKQVVLYLTNKLPKDPENLGDVNDKSQIHLLIHRKGIYEPCKNN